MKYKVIIFDFDNTLCNMNIYRAGIELMDIDNYEKTVRIGGVVRPLETLFNNYIELYSIFCDLKQAGVKLCIASFGSFDLIKKILDCMFYGQFDYILTSDTVIQETNKFIIMVQRHIVDLACPSFYGKNIMLKRIMDKFDVYDPHHVLFFDDDESNYKCAQTLHIERHHVSTHGITPELLRSLLYKTKYIIFTPIKHN
jgi:HAD superfamily phosphatase (TIGR01681 family)